MTNQYWSAYYANSMILIPTSARTTIGVIIHIDPMVVIDINFIEKMRDAFLQIIEKGNPIISHPSQEELSKVPVFYKKLGFKSHKAFKNQSVAYEIKSINDVYSIELWKAVFSDGSRHDEHKTTTFPSGTPVETVVDRLIEIIQETHK